MFLLLRVTLVLSVLSWVADDAAAGILFRGGHRAMVARSGITPLQIGSYEGVGMSTRSYADAARAACYYGQKQILSVQYSRVGSRYYALLRYR